MNYFVHEKALCESSSIGAGTRIWAFAHVLPGAKIGAGCNICDGVFVENDVVVGDNVTVKCGVQLWDGVTLEDDVFVGPNATFTNDIRPRSKVYPEAFLRTTVEQGASIGANATILPGLRIGRNAMIGAGAVVTHSVPSNAIVVGNPARIIGYADAAAASSGETAAAASVGDVSPLIKSVQLRTLNTAEDVAGRQLSGVEFERDIPFVPARFQLIQGPHTPDERSELAPTRCHRFLIALHGSVLVTTHGAEQRQQFVLDNPTLGLYLPPMLQGIGYKYSDNAMLLVFTSGFDASRD
jgi:UDP-2-acetamido-3-amino-2,3-dideoxy-glucuronate N-acetyltransferase